MNLDAREVVAKAKTTISSLSSRVDPEKTRSTASAPAPPSQAARFFSAEFRFFSAEVGAFEVFTAEGEPGALSTFMCPEVPGASGYSESVALVTPDAVLDARDTGPGGVLEASRPAPGVKVKLDVGD